jgi:serine/threonine protein kinase
VTKVRDFLGRYRLTRLIRVGNSCAVWEAVKDGSDDRLALKVLRQDLRGDKEELGYLKHEFEVAEKLKHPNIIRIHEFKLDKQTPYLAMELYSEKNMKQALRSGVDRYAYYVPKIVEGTAQALYHLHENGWAHCDIKPDNILVSEQGEVKLIDFTISEKMGFRFFGRKKNIKGTRSYMSPEQIRGKGLDARSDLYSFGCVLFELLSGKPPYTGSTPNELLEKHLTAAIPSVQVHNDNVTPEGANIIKRMMAKSLKDRPETMWEFLREFRHVRLFKKAPKKSEKLAIDDDQATS